jgi:hypothetical protein
VKRRFSRFVAWLVAVVLMCVGIVSLFPNARAARADDSRNSPLHMARGETTTPLPEFISPISPSTKARTSPVSSNGGFGPM